MNRIMLCLAVLLFAAVVAGCGSGLGTYSGPVSIIGKVNPASGTVVTSVEAWDQLPPDPQHPDFSHRIAQTIPDPITYRFTVNVQQTRTVYKVIWYATGGGTGMKGDGPYVLNSQIFDWGTTDVP